jgi:chemotaxis signal transduction protein
MTNSGYVEVFGPSGFFKGADDVLLYAHGIVNPSGEVCGAVVLKFDLQSELHSIFKALQRDNVVILLLDDRARVVASSDATSGFKSGDTIDLPTTHPGEYPICTVQGVEYLFAHCTTRGYQGYAGPGWTALSLLPLDAAFSAPQGNDANTPQGREIEIELDNPQLQDIIARARAIEKDLNRVIWNGKLQDSSANSASALGPVFAEIGRTSFQTISAFDGAILELKQLLMAGRRTELAAHAALAVDIMDRNLYERANDCRWWALSEEFAEILDTLEHGPSATASQRAGEILAHLNSLYTVYQRVALFDRQGRIVAVSKDAQTLAPAAAIPTALLQRTLSLKDTQAYAVSGMEPHALADGDATYLYCAPIYKAGHTVALGGIALAFNCRAELKAMLQDSLPAGAASLGFFLAEDGRVLASTDDGVAVGDLPEFAAAVGFGESHLAKEALVHWNGGTFLMGLGQSKGYREFKVSDGYRDPVRSVLLARVEPSPLPLKGHLLPRPAVHRTAATQQYGVVQCGRMLFALSSVHVVEAVSTTALTAPAAASDSLGLMNYASAGQVAVLPTYDSCKLTGQEPIADASKAVAIILRGAHQNVALLVDRLVDVIECNGLEPPPGGISADSPWISGFIHDDQAHTEPVFALDPAGL